MKNEQKFYSALENIFIGEAGQKIEGKSGYVNLMKLKSQYFAQIKPFIENEVNDTFKHDTAAREHVRHHRDDRPRHTSPAARGGRGARRHERHREVAP